MNSKEWYTCGALHSEDGPVVEKQYVDGPHIRWWSGKETWYMNNIEYSKQNYDLFLTLRNIGYSDKVIEKLVKNKEEQDKQT